MSVMVPIALYGWIPLALVIFALLQPRRAMLVTLIGGHLFLPMAGYDLPGPLDWTKFNVTGVAVVLGVVLYDARTLWSFRPHWFDIPALLFCLWPAVSSLGNGLTEAGDIATPVVEHLLGYGVPYLLGRVYFRGIEDAQELTWAVFIGGLVYLPLCLYEIRMSPQLHWRVYGFYQHQFLQSRRGGGWRPVVFMQHGLAVGMWMAAASLAGIALWRLKLAARFYGLKIAWLVLALLVTTVLCKSSGATTLLVLGTVILLTWGRGTGRWLLMILVAYVPAYMIVRTAGLVSGAQICDVAAKVFPEERVASMRGRLMQEDILTRNAMMHPLLGWGPWGAFRTGGEEGGRVGVTDGMWAIVFGKYGIVGLVSFALLLLLPAIYLVFGEAIRNREKPTLVALGSITVLFMHDCLMNAMPNPVFILISGALLTVCFATLTIVKSDRATRRAGVFSVRT